MDFAKSEVEALKVAEAQSAQESQRELDELRLAFAAVITADPVFA